MSSATGETADRKLSAELNPQMGEWERHMEWINVKLALVMVSSQLPSVH